MSTIFLTKQAAIDRLVELRKEIVEFNKKQQKALDQYNKIMKENFGFIEDGKTIDKLDIILLIQKLQAQNQIVG
jgi:histone H3/H4